MTDIKKKKHAPLILITAGIAAVLWASAFPAIKVALQEFSPYHVALLRYCAASAALAVVALVKRLPLPALKDIPVFLLLGLIGFTIYNIALNYGQVTVPAATSSFIVASAPIWMAIIAALFLGEKLKPLGWFGIILSFVGVGIIALGSAGGIQLNVRALAILGASLASALYSLGQKPLLKRYSPLQIVTYAIWSEHCCSCLSEAEWLTESAMLRSQRFCPLFTWAFSQAQSGIFFGQWSCHACLPPKPAFFSI